MGGEYDDFGFEISPRRPRGGCHGKTGPRSFRSLQPGRLQPLQLEEAVFRRAPPLGVLPRRGSGRVIAGREEALAPMRGG